MASLYPDISHYHPVSNWSKVKKNCPFLISKGTQGTSYIDSTLDSFIQGCEDNSIPYWLYTYLNADGKELDQAKFLVSTCKGKVGSHFVGYILDVEAGNKASNVKSALEYLEGLGKAMIYTMYSQYDTYKSVITGRASTTAFWEARYGTNSGSYSSKYPCHDGADLHQYTSAGSCSGVSGNCDLNRLTGKKDESWFLSGIGGSGSTSSGSSSSSKSSSSSGSSSFKTGDKVTLSKTPIYASSTDTSKSGTKSGTFYIWDATIKNNRIRITNKATNVGVSGAVTGWVNVSDIGGSTTSSSSSSSKTSSSSSSSKSFKAGDKVTLSKTPLYASSTASSKSGTKSGTFYIWDATIKNNRIRITNKATNVGVSGAVTGWVNVSDL